jgi:glucose/arabinose dehydrogenase
MQTLARLLTAAVIAWAGLGGARVTVLPALRLVPYASGLSQPVAIVQDPLDVRVQFVVQQGGRIRTLVDGQLQAADFLNLGGAITTGGERGLLGLAFPSGQAQRLFVNFTDPSGNTVVARFTRSANPLVADPASRFDLLWSTGERLIRQPFANHNGGCLQFGPDGYLYIGMGDGGSGDDPQNNAQNPSSLLGKLLRIDVSVPDGDAAGFRIPVDNPFASSSRPEIWAFGMRNPWRFSFDDPAKGGTGALVIGDVGQNQWEEVDYEGPGHGGRNYGWRNREGAHDHVTSVPPAFLPLTDPVYEYDHTVGQSITGGYVYRGAALPGMRGRYVFGDFVAGRIWSMAIAPNGAGSATIADLVEHTAALQFAGNISSFGVDAGGELFLVDYAHGAVLRIIR